MKKLIITLASLFILTAATAQGFTGTGVGYTLNNTQGQLHANYSFVQVINSLYFELGSGYLNDSQYISAAGGYAVKLNNNSYIVPTVSINIGQQGIMRFSGGMGVNLITHLTPKAFIVTGLGVNQPAKIGFGYRF